MKVIRFDQFGEPSEVLRLDQAPVPEPGPGEVRVRMIASPINPSDLLTVQGRYGVRPALPFVPGYEGVGVVDKAGPGLIGGFLVGRRVAVLNQAGGNWGETVVVPAIRAIPVPADLPDAQVASFFVNPATVLAMARHVLKVPKGAWLLQSAAGSTLGRMMIKLGGHDGFKTLNIVRRPEAMDELRRFGGDVDPQFSSTVHEWTAGNPLLLRELVAAAVMRRIETTPAGARQVRELSPEGVGRLVLRRIAPLGPRSLVLAEATAVLGDDADIDRAAELAGLSRTDAARAAGALQGIDVLAGSERLTFVHPLIRRAIYDNMDHARRESLHASAAGMLAAAEAAPARVAAHLLAVGPRGNPHAVASLRAAARDAMAQGAPAAAATYLERARAEPPPAEERMSLTLALGLAEARVRPADSVPQLMNVIEATDDDALLAQATIALAGVLHELGRESEWEPIALRVMDRIVDDRAARQVEAQYVFLGSFDAEHCPAAKRRLDGIAVVEGNDDPASRLLLGLQASHLLREGARPQAALERARASLAGDVLLRANTLAYGIPCSTLTHLDHFDEAMVAVDVVLAHTTRTGFLAMFKVASTTRAWIALGRGDLSEAEAEALLASGTDRWRIVGHDVGSSELGQIALHRGDLERAADHLDYADEVEQPAAWGWSISRGHRGQLRAAQGRLDEALDDLLTAGRRLAAFGCVNPALFPWRSEAALVLSRLGRRDDALELAHEEVELARVWGAPRPLGGALCSAGLVSGGRSGLALLREATAVLEPSPAMLVRARAATELGAALRRANQRAEAREPLALGLELAERAGATALVKRAREELIATGARPRRAARTGVASLTASERRIAHLAAEGQTNRDIAQALFVTPKTVEVHLSHTYQKLELRSRSQLPEALRAHEQHLTH